MLVLAGRGRRREDGAARARDRVRVRPDRSCARWASSRRWSWRTRRCISCRAVLLDRFDRIPAPQRDALETTFGLREGPVPDRFLVGLATLSLLSEAAQERPLLCAIDDAQWLDRASAQVLAFVARRLLAESVVLLAATREAAGKCGQLPELVVEGLRDTDARALLASAIPGRLDERVADQLLVEARGNPLALLELPRGLSPAQLAGGFGFPRALSLSGKIEESFVNRLEALPAGHAAAAVGGRGGADRRPGTLVARGRSDWGSLTLCSTRRSRRACSKSTAGFGFAIRSHARRSTGRRRRTRGDRFTGRWPRRPTRDVDPDRRAWHLAEAAAGPDEGVAAELERAAGRAQARGGLAAAAAFLERAATLTAEPSAARAACAGGGADRVRSGRARRRARSARRPRRPARSTMSNAARCICCALRSRSPPSAAATRPSSC